MKAFDSPLFVIEAQLMRDRVEDFETYPFNLPAVRNLASIEFTTPVTFLIGENGSGKSTLIEAIAIAWGLNPEGGSRHFRFTTARSHSELHAYLRLVKSAKKARDSYFLRAESFFNVATQIDELGVNAGYGNASLHAMSHGESFFQLLLERFKGRGLYILDEPEAALSPTRQLAALARMHQLVSGGSQFIVATHSPILMAYPGARILQLEPSGLREVRYEETEHYSVTREFLNHREAMLRELLIEE